MLNDDNYTLSLTASNSYFVTVTGIITGCNNTNPYLFISLRTKPGPTYIYIDSSMNWININPSTLFTSYDWGFSSLMSSLVTCSNNTKRFICNNRALAGPTYSEDCFRFWQASSRNNSLESSPNPWFPRPPFTFGDSSWQNLILLEGDISPRVIVYFFFDFPLGQQ